MSKKLLPWLILFSALGLAVTAAYYSVIGLSKLFAGVSTAVIIMASFLEISKLTLATLLSSYWGKINKILKIYLISALLVLVLITSAGIYGMLSSGYQDTANKIERTDSKIELLEKRLSNYNEQLNVYTDEKTLTNQAITGLRQGLSNNTIQYIDKNSGQLITTTSSSTRRALEKQLDQAINRQTVVNNKTDSLNIKIFDLQTEVGEVKINNDLESEIGPLKYLAKLTGRSMDVVINWLILVIIFVFDPLAVSLIIAANFAFTQIREKEENIKKKTIINNLNKKKMNLFSRKKTKKSDSKKEITPQLEQEQTRMEDKNTPIIDSENKITEGDSNNGDTLKKLEELPLHVDKSQEKVEKSKLNWEQKETVRMEDEKLASTGTSGFLKNKILKRRKNRSW